MKTIDWKEVSLNPQMSKQFTLKVYKKFESLSTSQETAENIEEGYDTLVKSTEEVALATLPKKKNRTQFKHSHSLGVIEARSRLKLDGAYLNDEVDFINGKISRLTDENISKKHHLAWKSIKEISSKNSGSSVRIKGGSSKKRLESWLSHFKKFCWRVFQSTQQ